MNKINLFNDIQILPRGLYLQIGFVVKTLDPTVIRSNEPEEVLAYSYLSLGNRFIIPWRKFKGKLRRLVMEQQRNFGISPDCSLKDNLCMKCPSCFLFGGTGETSQNKVSYNLLSRILGETLISLQEVKDVFTYTANAVDEKDYTTGQALMTTVAVPPETEFLGIVTIKDPTSEIAAIIVDNLKRVKRIGASNREWGRCETAILGYKLSDREDLSVYELIQKNEIAKVFEKVESLKLPGDIESCFKKIDKQIKQILPKPKK
uniref:Type I-D CRISPR-associated protein Cas7/Csc2 n=1 Tax=candidate division WOR-3 bacterium TaxID=2052148 RepID=A0A7C4U6J9_UNCW3